MKQQEVFNKIGGIIREINEQYEYLESLENVYNDLELELLVANAQFLTDHIEVLRKLNKQNEQTKQVVETPAKTVAGPSYFEPVIDEEPASLTEETPETPAETTHTFEFDMPAREENNAAEEIETDKPEEVITERETIRHELTLEDIGEDWDEDELEDEEKQADDEIIPEPALTRPAAIVKEPEPVIETKEPEPAAETPEPEPGPQPVVIETTHTQILVEEDKIITLNDKMSAQLGSASRMSDQLSGQPITDLKSAISINDKLLYIKELFNGYSLAYSEAIELLNRVKTLEEAQKFLNNSYATKNNWQDKQATADKFYALLQRRYTI